MKLAENVNGLESGGWGEVHLQRALFLVNCSLCTVLCTFVLGEQFTLYCGLGLLLFTCINANTTNKQSNNGSESGGQVKCIFHCAL